MVLVVVAIVLHVVQLTKCLFSKLLLHLLFNIFFFLEDFCGFPQTLLFTIFSKFDTYFNVFHPFNRPTMVIHPAHVDLCFHGRRCAKYASVVCRLVLHMLLFVPWFFALI